MTNEKLLEIITSLEVEMIEHRRYLHEHPELSSEEFETSQYLQKYMQALGLEINLVEGTGFYAVLDTKKPGKTVGIRTDIDALPIQENDNNLVQKRQVKSLVDGKMHACGHDGHMAVVLAAAKALVNNQRDLSGKVVFIFEEAEEIGGGIHQMIEALEPLNIDAIYGTHLASFMDTGDICLDAGPRMAGSVLFEFDVIGKGGHGSRPDLSVNPIVALAHIITALNSAWNNQLDVSKTVTLGITTVHSGSAVNVFDDSAYCGGSFRFFDEVEGAKSLELLKKVAHLTAEIHNCQVFFRDSTRLGPRPVINDDNLSSLAIAGVSSLFPNKVVNGIDWYASESFYHYSKLCPTLFAFVGIKNNELGSGAEHHNQYFDMDEAALKYSLGASLKFIYDYLNN